MDDEKLDLSALDPSADSARWERLVGSVTAASMRARAARLRPNPLLLQLATWSRPMLAAAAAVALVSLTWVMRSAAPARREGTGQVAGADEPAPALLAWALKNQMPTPAELFEALEGDGRAQR